MHMPNFNFLDHFEGELCEEQNQKRRKLDQKITFSRLRRGAMRLKNQKPKRHVYQKQTQKRRKLDQKIISFEL